MPSLENTETGVARNPLVDVMERLARIEARLDTMATREDLAKLETKLTDKFWSTLVRHRPHGRRPGRRGDQGLALVGPPVT